VRDARSSTAAALVGTLWGAMELTLGTVLHLSRMPLRGVFMSVIGLICLVTLRRLRGRPGICMEAGAVAAFVKIFGLGGLFPGPLIGILLEAAVVEGSFLLGGSRLISAVIAGALAVALTPLEMLVMLRIAAGRDAMDAFIGIVLDLIGRVGLPFQDPRALLGLAVVSAALGGGIAGAWAWHTASEVGKRLAE